MYRHPIRTMFVLAAVVAALVLSSSAVATRTTPFSSTYDALTTESPCGYPLERHDVGKAHGRSSPDRFDVTNAGVVVWTNLANGLSVTQKYQTLFKNANFVDNGNGTLTLDQTTVDSSTMYGPNGEVLLRDHGPVTTHLTINPEASDPDDFVVSQEIVFAHGAHPDFCEALTAAIGPGATL